MLKMLLSLVWRTGKSNGVLSLNKFYKDLTLFNSSLALWNIKEAQYWHPKLNEKTKRLTPSQLVTSTLPDAEPQSQDIGKVVSIRSIYSNVDAELLDGYNTKQVCELSSDQFLHFNINFYFHIRFVLCTSVAYSRFGLF